MAELPPPVLIAPAPYEVSFGRIAGRAPGAATIRVSIGRRVVAERKLGRKRFDFRVELPQRDVRLTVTALDAHGRRAATSVWPVFGLPREAAPRGPPRRAHEDAQLTRTINGLARGFSGTCAILVQDLRTGAAATWNAGTAFPAASTLKVAIAIQVLIAHRGRPSGRLDRLLRRMLVPSDDKPANELLVWLGGSTSGGAAMVNATMHGLGMTNTDMYGGYEVQSNAPSFVGKRTTASDFALLLRHLHLAADGRGKLAQRFRGSFVPADARFLLYLLAHARPNWLAQYLPGVAMAHKPGWIRRARHDAGLVYTPRGVFLAVVLTWNPNGVGTSSDVLAGRVAQAAFARFTRRGGRAASGRSARPRRD